MCIRDRCMMPQNQWLTNHTPLAWGILRNVPFALLGLLIRCV